MVASENWAWGAEDEQTKLSIFFVSTAYFFFLQIEWITYDKNYWIPWSDKTPAVWKRQIPWVLSAQQALSEH